MTPQMPSASAAAPTRDPAPRPAGETGDSPQRPAQRLHAAALAYDLPREAAALRRERSWDRGDRNAKTLVQEPGLRAVLVALRPGARLDDHASHAQVTVQGLAGRLRVHLADRTVEVGPGRLVSIEPGVAHALEALDETTFLLTIAGTRTGPTPRSARADHAAAAGRAADARSGQTWEDDGGRG
jgi:quercetin dioxygenase-like cupin family protein